jgi:transposase
MATTKKKIIKYILVEGSIKTDNFISFMDDLNKLNQNYTYLIDNASIHSNKKTKNFFKEKKIHIIFNAPYQSKFNPIEMVFSLLRKKINKKIVKTEKEIKEVIDLFIIETKKEILTNIFNHSSKILKLYLEINKV